MRLPTLTFARLADKSIWQCAILSRRGRMNENSRHRARERERETRGFFCLFWFSVFLSFRFFPLPRDAPRTPVSELKVRSVGSADSRYRVFLLLRKIAQTATRINATAGCAITFRLTGNFLNYNTATIYLAITELYAPLRRS